jgi:glycosyltransferase involved in cell wall biosynthesis
MPSFIDQILVVDNNSTDNTAKVAKKMGARVIKEKVQGYGAAIRSGITKAKSDLIVVMDGDGTYSPKEIKNLIQYMLDKKYDFVSANRFNSKYKIAMPFLNLVGNIILTFLTKMLFNKNIQDSQSGMFLFKSTLLPQLQTRTNGMSFSEEIKIEAIGNKKIRFSEYPIPYHDHHRLGKKKLRIWEDGFDNIFFLFRKWLEIKKLRKVS